MSVRGEMGCRGGDVNSLSNHGGCLLRGDKGLVNIDVTHEGGTGTCPDVVDLGYSDVPIVEAWAELPVWPEHVSSSVEEGFWIGPDSHPSVDGDALDQCALSSGCGRR
ncbi:hypothetical protein ABOM_011397 [Aspergillus bombycis]|uniref:Uncharacterized protein n=1 Tax=Aspergillus bombycis TaxID=109264 RepID=A0A1F7ZLV5_9EURO|nr:hypothetical protein ABOM_011397 [Aspergillus bombycis]OGM40098.1 hypothetical protein ABOM_011397 [Aspergillus bombycis]